MKNVRFLILLVLVSMFLASCSDLKHETQVELEDQGLLAKLLQDAPDDVRIADSK